MPTEARGAVAYRGRRAGRTLFGLAMLLEGASVCCGNAANAWRCNDRSNKRAVSTSRADLYMCIYSALFWGDSPRWQWGYASHDSLW